VKVFDLCCQGAHQFEGWFASQEDFDAQLADRRIGCPLCGSVLIRRLPSAARLNLGPAEQPARGEAVDPAQLQTAAVRAAMQLLANTEDVGDRFAEEARRIHYKEAPERGIRGVATRSEAQALEEEGVRVLAFPFPELAKDTIQ
jgi:hypothetical protein